MSTIARGLQVTPALVGESEVNSGHLPASSRLAQLTAWRGKTEPLCPRVWVGTACTIRVTSGGDKRFLLGFSCATDYPIGDAVASGHVRFCERLAVA